MRDDLALIFWTVWLVCGALAVWMTMRNRFLGVGIRPGCRWRNAFWLVVTWAFGPISLAGVLIEYVVSA